MFSNAPHNSKPPTRNCRIKSPNASRRRRRCARAKFANGQSWSPHWIALSGSIKRGRLSSLIGRPRRPSAILVPKYWASNSPRRLFPLLGEIELAHYLTTGEGPILAKRIEMPAMRADGTEFLAELAITRIDLGGSPMFTTLDAWFRWRLNASRPLCFTRSL